MITTYSSKNKNIVNPKTTKNRSTYPQGHAHKATPPRNSAHPPKFTPIEHLLQFYGDITIYLELEVIQFWGMGGIFCGCGFVGVALGVRRTIFHGFGINRCFFFELYQAIVHLYLCPAVFFI